MNRFEQLTDDEAPDLVEHGVRTAKIAVAISRVLNVPADITADIADAARLHDIGKAKIDVEILNKPGPLDAREWEELKRHPQIGYDIIHNDVEPRVSRLILRHHERLDGTGYPNGLSADAIDLPLRILHVADAFDAITSDRPYQPAMPVEHAVSELTSNLGTQFDADAVGALIEVVTYRGLETEQSRFALPIRHRMAAVG